jgi:hypothetical protein
MHPCSYRLIVFEYCEFFWLALGSLSVAKSRMAQLVVFRSAKDDQVSGCYYRPALHVMDGFNKLHLAAALAD